METNNIMQKIHDARTKRAWKNLIDREVLFGRYGGSYTHAELNLLRDLYPCWEKLSVNYTTAAA